MPTLPVAEGFDELASWLIIAAIAAMALWPLLFWLFSKRPRKPRPVHYARRSYLLSNEERLFMAALVEATADRYLVYPKVSVADILAIRMDPLADDEFRSGLEHLQRSAGFLLCNKLDDSIQAVVDLQPPGLNKRAASADPLHGIFQSVGLPRVAIDLAPFYDSAEIRAAITMALAPRALSASPPDGRREPRISDLDKLTF